MEPRYHAEPHTDSTQSLASYCILHAGDEKAHLIERMLAGLQLPGLTCRWMSSPHQRAQAAALMQVSAAWDAVHLAGAAACCVPARPSCKDQLCLMRLVSAQPWLLLHLLCSRHGAHWSCQASVMLQRALPVRCTHQQCCVCQQIPQQRRARTQTDQLAAALLPAQKRLARCASLAQVLGALRAAIQTAWGRLAAHAAP